MQAFLSGIMKCFDIYIGGFGKAIKHDEGFRYRAGWKVLSNLHIDDDDGYGFFLMLRHQPSVTIPCLFPYYGVTNEADSRAESLLTLDAIEEAYFSKQAVQS